MRDAEGVMMVLQIDAPEAISLIERISELTGESAETTVEVALRERLDRLRDPDEESARRAKVQALVDDIAARFKTSDQPYIDHGDLLYGEDGLPR
jgi:hypothetical protein